MKKLIATLIMLSAFSSNADPVNADSDVNKAFTTKLALKSLLLDITKVSSKRVVAVGERGHILYSDDGQKWMQANVPTQAMLTAVTFQNESVGWAVGHDATILNTQDGGENWTLVSAAPELEKPLLDIVETNDSLLAVGAYGLIYSSNDNGKSWQTAFFDQLLYEEDREYLEEIKEESEEEYLEERSFILPHFNRYLTTESGDYIFGEAGFIGEKSTGQWQRIEEFYNGSFLDGVKTSQGTLIAVGLRGSIYRSTDSGVNWNKIETPSTHSLNAVVQMANGRIVGVGNSGSYVISDNDGESFTVNQFDDGLSLVSAVEFKGQLLAASERGIKEITFGSEK